MLALHNNDFELVASELRTEFKEKVTVKDCVLQRFALLFNELYNPRESPETRYCPVRARSNLGPIILRTAYLEFLPTAPLCKFHRRAASFLCCDQLAAFSSR